MKIRTNKDNDFVTIGFGNICDIKKIIIQIFDNLKKNTFINYENFDYLIKEYDNEYSIKMPYKVEIWCNVNYEKICIIRESILIKDDDFAIQCYKQLELWNKMLSTMCIAGIIKIITDIKQNP